MNCWTSWWCLQWETTFTLENSASDPKAFGPFSCRGNGTNQLSRQLNALTKNSLPNSSWQPMSATKFGWKNAKYPLAGTTWTFDHWFLFNCLTSTFWHLPHGSTSHFRDDSPRRSHLPKRRQMFGTGAGQWQARKEKRQVKRGSPRPHQEWAPPRQTLHAREWNVGHRFCKKEHQQAPKVGQKEYMLPQLFPHQVLFQQLLKYREPRQGQQDPSNNYGRNEILDQFMLPELTGWVGV